MKACHCAVQGFPGSNKIFILLMRLPPWAQEILESRTVKAESISGVVSLSTCIFLMYLPQGHSVGHCRIHGTHLDRPVL